MSYQFYIGHCDICMNINLALDSLLYIDMGYNSLKPSDAYMHQ